MPIFIGHFLWCAFALCIYASAQKKEKHFLCLNSFCCFVYACIGSDYYTKNAEYWLFIFAFCTCSFYFIFVFKKPVSLVFIAHFLTYTILSSRFFFGNLSLFLALKWDLQIEAAIAIRLGWIISGPFLVILTLYLFAWRFPILSSSDKVERRLLLFSLGALYCIIQLTHFSGFFKEDIRTLLLSGVFSLLLFSFLLSICLYSAIIKEAEEIKRQNTAYSLQMEGLALLNEAITTHLEKTARLRHDQRHLLTLLDLHAQKNDIVSIKNLIGKNLEDFVMSFNRITGDDVIDGILTLYINRARAKHILIDIQGLSLLDLPLSRDDLSLLLSNTFENAIEATQFVEEDFRHIVLSLTKNNETGTLALLIQNPYEGGVLFSREGLPLSAKGEMHGYGTRSMRYIVSKYQGICTFSTEEKNFIFRAAFFPSI